MPTIDQLDAVIVASDDDVLPVSQAGTARRVSRSQLLAGTQVALSLTPGLLGRITAGLGPPEQVAIGNGLSLANGILSGSPRYSANALQAATGVSLTDVVPIGQNGQDRSVSVKTLLSVNGADVSGQVARSSLGTTRRITEWLSDSIAVEAFGAVGDGVTDDSNAFRLAVASGSPICLGPKTYRVDGQWDIQNPVILVGTPGVSSLCRSIQHGGAWINVSSTSFTAIGVTFDAGNLPGDSWGVLLGPTCLRSIFRQCSFTNATGPSLGSGLTIQARDGVTGHQSSHSIRDCTFSNNVCHGLWVQAACGAEIRACQAFSNGGFGINLDFNDPSFQQIVRQCAITECKCWGNSRGISVGNYNSTNQEPPRWGLENPDAIDIIVSSNICSGNSAYGIAVSGQRILVTNNVIAVQSNSDTASGILCNAGLSTISENIVSGPGQFGIDAGSCNDLAISANTIQNLAVGINSGGSKRVKIHDNYLTKNRRSITLFQVETDGRGRNFGIACSDIWINHNDIQMEAGNGGVFLIDGPERIEIIANRFSSPSPSSLADTCWTYTDSAIISQNKWNGLSETIVVPQVKDSLIQLVIPEILDTILIDPTATKVDVIIGKHQADMIGQVTLVRVTNGGSGYTQASVVFSDQGSGAAATAYIRDGIVIGIAMTANGNGYGTGSSAIISGDGQGATVLPFVSVPLAQGRRITLRSASSVRYTQRPWQTNWTNSDITIPAGGQIVWQAVAGHWQAAWFNNTDYVQPDGNGSVIIKSVTGDIRFRPALGGGVRFTSDLETVGFLTSFGRGSPEGVVIAPPGSDYRNLNGGSGMTLWIKQTGNGSQGWLSVA